MRTLAIVTLAAALLAGPGAARAEGNVDRLAPTTSGLRVKFAQGVALESVGRWADALDRFEAIARTRPTAEVQFHVGLCLDRLGRLRRAEHAYKDARDRGRSSAPIVVSEATERLQDLDARMPRVTVTVSGDATGVTILLDGELIEGGRVERVDAGPHVAVAMLGRLPIAAVAFSTQERRSRAVTLNLLVGGRGRTAPVQADPGGSPIARATPSR